MTEPATGKNPNRDTSDSATANGMPDHLKVLEVNGKKVHLLGTAHVSAKSAEEAKDLIHEIKPDSVCVELCESRYQSITKADAWPDMDLFQIVRKKQATTLLAHLILAAFQRRMGEHLGIKPGAEMVTAIEAANATGAELVLADRNIQATLLRTWRALGFFTKFRLLGQLILTLVMPTEMEEEEIEALKKQDMLTQVMEAFSQSFPKAKVTLIDERDLFLSEKIRTAPGKTVVAIVGAGHMKGILKLLETERKEAVDLEPLLVIPRGSYWGKAIQWGIPALVIGLIGYGFFAMDASVSWEMIKIWVLANGVLAAIGATLAFAHPITIVTAFVAAPITSLNPMVAAGWVAGLCEVIVHKPKVRDFETLPTDITSMKGFWRNRITRVLLVVALANLGSSLGTFIGLPLMSSLL